MRHQAPNVTTKQELLSSISRGFEIKVLPSVVTRFCQQSRDAPKPVLLMMALWEQRPRKNPPGMNVACIANFRQTPLIRPAKVSTVTNEPARVGQHIKVPRDYVE